MRLTRREFCQGTATVALATAFGLSTLPPFSGAALAQAKVSEVELMAPGALPDMVMGDAKAPVGGSDTVLVTLKTADGKSGQARFKK